MKSVIEKNVGSVKKEQYPVLARFSPGASLGRDFIVLFTGPEKGTVVWTEEDCMHSLGKYRTDWLGPDNEERWTILPEGYKVVLEN